MIDPTSITSVIIIAKSFFFYKSKKKKEDKNCQILIVTLLPPLSSVTLSPSSWHHSRSLSPPLRSITNAITQPLLHHPSSPPAPTTPFTTKSFVLSFCGSLFSYQMLYTCIIEEDFQASNRIYQKISNWIQFLYPSFISTNNSPPRSSRHF